MDMNVDELGTTEQFVVDRLTKVSQSLNKHTKELLAEIEKLEGADWESAIRDSKKKDGLTKILDGLERLDSNLATSMVLVLIAKIMGEGDNSG